MKQLKNNFREYLRTPFPYLFLGLCLFLGTSMIRNEAFGSALSNNVQSNVLPYELCVVCSDPNATDVLSDIGFTVSNFILFPVNALSMGLSGTLSGTLPPTLFSGVYMALCGIFGMLMPFIFYLAFNFYSVQKPDSSISIHARSISQ